QRSVVARSLQLAKPDHSCGHFVLHLSKSDLYRRYVSSQKAVAPFFGLHEFCRFFPPNRSKPDRTTEKPSATDATVPVSLTADKYQRRNHLDRGKPVLQMLSNGQSNRLLRRGLDFQSVFNLASQCNVQLTHLLRLCKL